MVAGLLGAVVGAFLFAAYYFVGVIAVNGFDHALAYGVRNSLGVFMFALIIWLIGVVVLGGPFWWLLHRFHKRGWITAVGLGLGLTFLISFGFSTNGFGFLPMGNVSFSASDSGGKTWIRGGLTAHGWHQAFWGSLWFSISGACAGFVTWWVAYRRA